MGGFVGLTCLLLFLFICAHKGQAYNFLFQCSLNNASHFRAGAEIGKLLTQKGHTVTLLLSEAYADTRYRSEFASLEFEFWKLNTTKEKFEQMLDDLQRSALDADIFEVLSKLGPKVIDVVKTECQTIFGDEDLILRLKKRNFDMIIIDPSLVCSIILSDYLNVPYMTMIPLAFSTWVSPHAGIPVNPSYVPSDYTTHSPKMTFYERVINLVAHAAFSSLEIFMKQEIGGYEISYSRTFKNSKLVLYNIDFAVEFPVPLPPNVIAVGGLTIQTSKPLPKNLELFMQSSGEEGVVIVSLGTFFQKYDEKLLQKFVQTFAKLPQKVLWKYSGPKINGLSNNVKTMEWLPLNDLLEHPKTRAFVYQAGNNGLYEAVYHGTPIVALPMWADQMNVAAKVKAREIGEIVFIAKASADELTKTILEVATNPKYKKNIKRLSAIFRDRPMTPVERAVYWIEHVMKYGAEVYRPASIDLSFIEYNLIDVYGFLLLVFLLAIYIFYKSCCFACRCCNWLCKRKSAETNDSKKKN